MPIIRQDNCNVQLNDDGAAFHLKGKADACVYNDGSVQIGDQKLALSDTQRTEVRLYLEQLRQVRNAASKVGLSAARFALSTVWDVSVGLFANSGNTRHRIENRADRFKQNVATSIRAPVDQLHDCGKNLAMAVEPLAPYLPDTLSKSTQNATHEDL